MASQNQIERSLNLQLQHDAPERLQAAGANWKDAQMGFYYGTGPNSEISIDVAIKASMLRVLNDDHAELPPQIWPAMAGMINSNTQVSGAVGIMLHAAAHEKPIVG